MALSFAIGEDTLTCSSLFSLTHKPFPKLSISDDVLHRIRKSRQEIEDIVERGETVYGVNTGFGFLANVRVSDQQLQQLQLNIIRSHACGVGEPVAIPIVRGMLIHKMHSFAQGYSGVSVGLLDKLRELLEHDIIPVVPGKGSVGASGDLAPLAHIGLTMLGEGDAFYQERLMPASQALQQAGVKPYEFKAKEGLSLINGTQFMTTLLADAVYRAKLLSNAALVAAGLSLSALRGSLKPFDERLNRIRRKKGQIEIARRFLGLFDHEDEIQRSHEHCDRVQDPYSLRCIPQVHGAVLDVLAFVANAVDDELNSVTDNPTVFPGGDAISGGNFHGEPIAMAADFLAVAIAELGSISERRIEKLTNPHFSDLPAFIVEEGGLNSGFMIPHVTAAALTSENKVLCHPASVDSIPTSADKEDHVSMGPTAAHKAISVAHNVAHILSIELLSACQALDLLHPLRPSTKLRLVHEKVRKMVPFLKADASLAEGIELIRDLIWNGEIIQH